MFACLSFRLAFFYRYQTSDEDNIYALLGTKFFQCRWHANIFTMVTLDQMAVGFEYSLVSVFTHSRNDTSRAFDSMVFNGVGPYIHNRNGYKTEIEFAYCWFYLILSFRAFLNCLLGSRIVLPMGFLISRI